MIAYVTLGTNDLPKAHAFYDALMSVVGAKRLVEVPEHGGLTMYGTAHDRPSLVITRPYDGGIAGVGNGTMVALMMKDRGQVDAFYAKALELAPKTTAHRVCARRKGHRPFTEHIFATQTATSSRQSGSANDTRV